MQSRDAERFRRGWLWKRSSWGYAIRVPMPNYLEYRDAYGTLRLVGAEIRSPRYGFAYRVDSIPETPGRSRTEVASNIRRICEHFGWIVVEE